LAGFFVCSCDYYGRIKSTRRLSFGSASSSSSSFEAYSAKNVAAPVPEATPAGQHGLTAEAASVPATAAAATTASVEVMAVVQAEAEPEVTGKTRRHASRTSVDWAHTIAASTPNRYRDCTPTAEVVDHRLLNKPVAQDPHQYAHGDHYCHCNQLGKTSY
jgi:hypothetical protein